MWNEAAIKCLDQFSVRSVNGRHRNSIFVGDQPDARHCSTLVGGTVISHHRTQRPSRFAAGYIRIQTADGTKYFDRKSRTIAGQPAFLFVYTRDIHSLSRIIDGIRKIVDQYQDGPFEELAALNELLDERLKISPLAYRLMSEGHRRSLLIDRLRQNTRQLWLEGGWAALEDFVNAANRSLTPQRPGLQSAVVVNASARTEEHDGSRHHQLLTSPDTISS
jgi:hypothetical protein